MTYDTAGHPCQSCGAPTGYATCVPCQARQSQFPLRSARKPVRLNSSPKRKDR